MESRWLSRLEGKLGPEEKSTPDMGQDAEQTPPGLQSTGPEVTLCSILFCKLTLTTF